MFEKFINAIFKEFINTIKNYVFKYWFLKGKSQADKVLWYLETHGRITNLQCHEIFGIRHAPSVIRDLRELFIKQGSEYAIKNESKKGCNRFGEKCHWVDYVLVKKDRNVSSQIRGTFETVYQNKIQVEQRG